jgi:hypothetical protein
VARKGSLVLSFLFEMHFNAITKENLMRKPVYFLFLLLAALGLSACARAPAKAVPSQETQRSHAHEAQDELKSEVSK